MNQAFQIAPIDIVIFALFLVAVVAVGLIKSKGEGKDSESFFLAGRGLVWWLIGISLIAANISSEQFVGMSGSAADYLGMAIASYEWMAAITLVVVAFFFLPYFLRTGIFTIPQFLEHRYNATARTLMAVSTLVLLVGVSLTGVIYAGALTMSELFAGYSFFGVTLNLTAWCWIIGIVAAVYVAAGGLNASAWADLIQGIALIVGGAVIAYFALEQLGDTPVAQLTASSANPRAIADDAGGLAKLVALNHEKMTMFLPRSDPNIPWTALVIGLWIPNFYYWGLNQYITQRVLGSSSLRQGQRGIVFAAAMKLIIPFIIVVPGIIAFNLYSADLRAIDQRRNAAEWTALDTHLGQAGSTHVFDAGIAWARINPARMTAIDAHNIAVLKAAGGRVDDLEGRTLDHGARVELGSRLNDTPGLTHHTLIGYKFDASLNLLIKNLLPTGSGLVGFVLAALLGAIVSSLAAVLNAASTIFTIDIFQKLRPQTTQRGLVLSGRIGIGVFAVIGCLLSPNLDKFGSIFKYIQEFQGYASPGILAVFVFGLLNRRAPGFTGVVGLLLNPLLYFIIAQLWPHIAFLDRMAICFFTVMLVMWIIGRAKPLASPVVFATNTDLNLETSAGAKTAGWIVVAVALALYVIFSPLGLAG